MGGENKRVVLVLGGTRSGKSLFAERLAAGMGGPVTYLATLDAGDGEMERRVAAHRERRPAGWTTVEEARDIPGRVSEAGKAPGVLLVDCVTGWLSNLLLDGDLPRPGATGAEKEEYIDSMVKELAKAILACRASVVLVSGEVGLGMVPPYPLGRIYRDIAGNANRTLATAAGEVYMVVAGLAVEIKSIAVNIEK
ncbi:MAG: bifunctional adenosylcobinamide kinase/adenosylcobinamide-phosphate guanylyltransferase [Bacillota bacterium]